MKKASIIRIISLLIFCSAALAQKVSPYMGGDVELVEAPNGAKYQ
jgi:hypothetical protein